MPTSYVGELICIRADENVIQGDYLYTLLSTNIYKSLLNREKRGQTSHIYPKDISGIPIPLPNISIQKAISDEVRRRRKEARRLREEASREWAEAKARFEARLLGGGQA